MDTLYHYCPITSFISIIESHSIHLSALNMSNDALEGRLISEIITRLSKIDSLDIESCKNLQEGVDFLESTYDGLGFCLSEEGDLLSQWRGYASDASGFSIGFSKNYLELLSDKHKKNISAGFNLKKVEYEISQQEDLVRPTYVKIKEMISGGKLKPPQPKGLLDLRTDEDISKEFEEYKKGYKSMIITIYELIDDLYALKTAAFSEEREWRLVSYMFREKSSTCEFKVSENRIIPIRVFDLEDLNVNPIKEIILGPKNKTPIHVLENLFEKHGYKDIEIKSSAASYR